MIKLKSRNTYLPSIIVSILLITIISFIVVSYERNLWGSYLLPAYIITGIIVFIFILFILFSIYIEPFISKKFKNKYIKLEEVLENLLKDINHTGRIEDIIKKNN